MRVELALFAIVSVAASTSASAQTGAIRGTVLDTRDGAAVARISVRLQRVPDVSEVSGVSGVSDTKSERIVLTDDEGRFAFEGVAAGERELYVSAVDFILV